MYPFGKTNLLLKICRFEFYDVITNMSKQMVVLVDDKSVR